MILLQFLQHPVLLGVRVEACSLEAAVFLSNDLHFRRELACVLKELILVILSRFENNVPSFTNPLGYKNSLFAGCYFAILPFLKVIFF